MLSGETVGAGIGLVVGSSLGIAINWRAPFFFLAGASIAVAVLLYRSLQEPQRGGSDRLEVNQASDRTDGDDLAVEAASQQGVSPVPDRILPQSQDMSYWQAAKYTLRIPTVRSIIVASAIGYFFFAGLRTFAVVLAVGFYGLPTAMVTAVAVTIGLAGLTGAVLGGRFTDRQLVHGRLTARVDTPPWAYMASAVVFLPALWTTTVWVALPLAALGAALLAATNPPLDAARLDIVPAHLWGRAESVRSVIRLAAEAAAPILFGLTADWFSSGARTGVGVRDAFAVMLFPLAANGVLLLAAHKTYPADVATAAASQGNRD